MPDSNPWWKYNFDIEVKGHGYKEFMNVHDTSYHCETLTCKTEYDYVKGQKSWGRNTKPCHKPYKFDLEVKRQCLIRIMNLRDISSQGDRPICQICYANVKANRSYSLDMKTWENPINLTLRSKVQVVSRSWKNARHHLMVIHPCAKYGKPMSNHKKVMGRTRICTDRRTDKQMDRQSDSYIPPWTSFAGGILIKYLIIWKFHTS